MAGKLGKVVKEINPNGTSQHCWNCLDKVPKELKDRWHSCPGGEECHRDENSGISLQLSFWLPVERDADISLQQ